MPNTELLVDVLAHIDLQPDSWNQGLWGATYVIPDSVGAMNECGTAFCVAGWALMLSGEPLEWGMTESGAFQGRNMLIGVRSDPYLGVASAAKRVLGVEGRYCIDQVEDRELDLFDGDNDLETVYVAACLLFGIDRDDLDHSVKLRSEALRLAREKVPA